MAISNSSKFKVFYCKSALPEAANAVVGGLYVRNGAIYLCNQDSENNIVWEKLDGVKAGASLPQSGMIEGEYFFNTTDKVLYYFNGTDWVGSQATALSQAVSFTITDGAADNPVTIATGSMAAGSTQATLTVSGVPAEKITAGALANGMTATTQAAGDNTTKIATTAFVKSAIDTAAVAVMHYKGTVDDTTVLAAVSSPVVGDVYNLASDGSNWAFSTTDPEAGTAGVDYIAVTGGYWEKLGSTLDTTYFAKTNESNTFTQANTVQGAFTASGGATVSSGLSTDTLTVSSTSSFGDDVTIANGKDLSVGGDLTVSGDSTLAGVTAGATTVSSITSTGAATIGAVGATADLTVNGNASVSGTFGATGASTLGGAVTLNGGAANVEENDDNHVAFAVGPNVDTTYAGAVAFSGETTAVTQSANDNSTKVATTAYVDSAITAGLTWTVLS